LRLAEHIKRARNPHYPVNHWIAKHGSENISINVLEYCDPAQLDAAEEKWIAELRTFRDWKQGGLNASLGGRNMPLTIEKVKQHVADSIKRGRPNQVLSWEKAKEIRDYYLNNEVSMSQVVRDLGLPRAAVMSCLSNETWKDPDYLPIVRRIKSERAKSAQKHDPYSSNRAKFNPQQVIELRYEYCQIGTSAQDLAKRHSCSYQTMVMLLNNQTYFDPEYANTRKDKFPGISQSHRDAISASSKGHKKPEGFGAKISAAMTGEGHSMAKLTEAQVVEMLARFAKGETVKTLAGEYGVSVAQARRIKTGERWGHLPR
jgi:DNA invertase Pin-like site-specific DNA recombinase